MSKQIIIVKPGTLTGKDKEKLTKDGNLVVEHENSSEFVFKTNPDPPPPPLEFDYVCCYRCGDRIYLTKERLGAIKKNGYSFYCPQGHSQAFPKKESV